ncbi:hypothetical protein ACSSWA_01480 [Melioribacter sp. Ez-97]|uniref:hypothetical protein n=1 Tax=Melioribacter sp. Ez-97 TaxID=3423434 RepID=UPI003ED9E19B
MNIEFTEHSCQRFCERINPNLLSITDYNQRLRAAKRSLKTILKTAYYISDNDRGVLLRSNLFGCDIIIKHKKLITVYATNKNGKRRKKCQNYMRQR